MATEILEKPRTHVRCGPFRVTRLMSKNPCNVRHVTARDCDTCPNHMARVTRCERGNEPEFGPYLVSMKR